MLENMFSTYLVDKPGYPRAGLAAAAGAPGGYGWCGHERPPWEPGWCVRRPAPGWALWRTPPCPHTPCCSHRVRPTLPCGPHSVFLKQGLVRTLHPLLPLRQLCAHLAMLPAQRLQPVVVGSAVPHPEVVDDNVYWWIAEGEGLAAGH